MDLWAFMCNEVARVDGIGLADLRRHPASFRETIKSSLRLIREIDFRRYRRVCREIAWIVNRVTGSSSGADYYRSIRTCNIEFTDAVGETQDIRIAIYACVLIHEATHGALDSRGIPYAAYNRVKIERLCVTEQNRFAARLTAIDPERYPEERLHETFIAGHWHADWTATPTQRRVSYLSRLFSDR
jgi:hypothetical protein